MLLNLQKIQNSYQELGTPASNHKNSNTIGGDVHYQLIIPETPGKTISQVTATYTNTSCYHPQTDLSPILAIGTEQYTTTTAGMSYPKKHSSSRLNHHLSDYKASSLVPKTRLDQYLHVPVLNSAYANIERGVSPDNVVRQRGIYSRGGKPRN